MVKHPRGQSTTGNQNPGGSVHRSVEPNASREIELIDACLAGRLDAFGDLVRPYQDRLFNTLFRVVGNREEAAELLQEALIRAYRGLASYHREASFYTWIYRIALNVALTSRRKQRLKVVSTEAGLGHQPFDLADEEHRSRPSRELERQELSELVEKALARVPEPYRAVLVLKDIEDLKYEEIAEILRIPVGTVRSRLHRARAEMRGLLQPLFDNGSL